MPKWIVSSAVSLVLLLTLVRTAQAVDSPVPTEVLNAANTALTMFKDKVSAEPNLYGFRTVAEVQSVTLGVGLRIHYFDVAKLRDAGVARLSATLQPTDAWEFTADVNGQPRAFLTIAKEDGAYRLGGFGGDARDYGTALVNFGRLTSAKGAAAEPTLLEYQGLHYLTANLGNEDVVLAEIQPDRARAGFAGGMDNTKLRAGEEMLAIARGNLGRDQGSIPVRAGGSGMPQPDHTSSRYSYWIAFGIAAVAGSIMLVARHRVDRR
ncbi:MAG: hypothetical protein ACYC5Y_06495 [Symbiobacteriia bacterium]